MAAAKACAKGQTRNAAGKCVKTPATTKGATVTTTATAPTAATATTKAVTATTVAAPAGSSAQRDKITIAFAAEPDFTDAWQGENRFEQVQMLDTLVVKDKKTGKFLPSLASELPKPVDAFQQEWEVKLRTDVVFHDGSPFNAQSVADQFNYARQIKGICENCGVTNAPNMTDVKAVNANTVRFTFNRSEPLFINRMIYSNIQKIVNGKPELIGTGPFQFVAWNKGKNFLMKANDKYWGPKPNVKNIEMRYIPDPAARMAALLAGEIDMVTNISLEDSGRAPQLVTADSSVLFYRIVLNNRDGVTADLRVRQALNYATDKEGMMKAFFNNQAAIDNCQSLTPDMTGYNPDLKAYPYDPAKAKALIKAAGAEGMKIDLYQSVDRWAKGTEIVTALAQMWGAAGLQVTVKNVPFAQWLEAAQKQPGPRPDAFFVGATMRTQDGSDLRTYLVSTPDGTTSSTADPQFDKMFADFSAIADPDARDKAFQQVSAKLCRDANFVFLFAPKLLTGVAKGISFTPDPRSDRWFKVAEFNFAK